MNRILITGAAGFIGSALCNRLASGNKVIGVDITGLPDGALNIAWEHADLTDEDSAVAICKKYSPDVVIHCAGIAHQKIGVVDSATYMRVNSEVTENLAKAAAESNPDVCFIFLSSVSVYGEGGQEVRSQKSEVRDQGSGDRREGREVGCQGSDVRGHEGDSGRGPGDGRKEDGECWPSSDYAVSKLDAEMRLSSLYDEGKLQNLVILRLAPVYDREWSLNLDRRVFAPEKVAYLRFGSGSQKMSALARPNLIDFVEFLIHRFRRFSQINADENNIKNNRTRQNNLCNQRNLRINVCDVEPYEFKTIIQIFKKSDVRPNRPVISVPLFFVWFATRIAGALLPDKRSWIHSCYDKLAYDLVFDNGKMLGTGFRPVHTLETIFDPQITQIEKQN